MGMNIVHVIAATDSEASNDLLGMLGIDVPTLIFQVVAFLILVLVLGKWVYPIFVGIIDKREADIAASSQAAEEAKKVADEASREVAELLRQARVEASEIVATAKKEATVMIDTAESKAKAKAASLVATARDDIDKERAATRTALHNEMIDLVALATEKVVGSTVTKDIDTTLIKEAVQ